MENLKPKEPLLAVMFGVVLAGLGQIYAGKIRRGIGFLFISVILLIPLIIVFLNPNARIISLLLVLIIIGFIYRIFVIVDGYSCAKAYNISNNLIRNVTTAKKIILTVGIIVIVLAVIIGSSWQGIVGLYNYLSGENYMEKGLYDKAAESYSKVIKVMPWSAVIYQFRAYAYVKQHNFDQAIADYNKSLEIKPGDAEAISRLSRMYYYRGTVYYEKNDFGRAITDYTKSIEINPNDANVYYNRGLAYAHEGNLSKAISDNSKAIES